MPAALGQSWLIRVFLVPMAVVVHGNEDEGGISVVEISVYSYGSLAKFS